MQAKFKIIAAMTAFGTIALFVKNIPLSTGEIALFRAMIALAVIAVYKLVAGNRVSFASIKKDLPVLFLSGAAIGFNWILLFEAYRYTTVSLATLSYYFAPALVMVACPVLFKEKVTIKQIVCFVMASAGLVMIIGFGGAGGAGGGVNHLLGIGFGLGAATLYATVILLNKYIKGVTGLDRTAVQFVAAVVVLLPYVLMTTGIHVTRLAPGGLVNLLILGLVHTGICYVLYFSSLQDLQGQEVAILSYLDPLVAVIISVSVLGEAITPMQVVGGILILGFTLLNELNVKHGKTSRFAKREG